MKTKFKFVVYLLFGVFILLGLLLGRILRPFRPRIETTLGFGEEGRKHFICALEEPIEKGVPEFIFHMQMAVPGESFTMYLPKGSYFLYAVPMDLSEDRVADLKNAMALIKLDPTVALPFPGNPYVSKR